MQRLAGPSVWQWHDKPDLAVRLAKLRAKIRDCPPGVRDLVAQALSRIERTAFVGGQARKVRPSERYFMVTLNAGGYNSLRKVKPKAALALAKTLGVSKADLFSHMGAVAMPAVAPLASQPAPRPLDAVRGPSVPNPPPSFGQGDLDLAGDFDLAAFEAPTLSGMTGMLGPTATSLPRGPVNKDVPWWVWPLLLALLWYIFVYNERKPRKLSRLHRNPTPISNVRPQRNPSPVDGGHRLGRIRVDKVGKSLVRVIS